MSGRQIIVANSTSPSSAIIAPQSESSGSLGHADSQQASTEQRPPEAWWQPWTHDPVAIATVLLFIATCGLWFTTFKLWKTTAKIAQDTVDDAKIQASKMERSIAEAAKAATAMQGIADATQANSDKLVESVEHQRIYGNMQLRAYVMSKDHVVANVKQGERPVFACKLHNSGFTPAHEVRCVSAVIPTMGDPHKEPIMFRKLVPGGTSSTMIGRDDFYVLPFIYDHISQIELNQIHAGERKLIFAGIISYRDAFGKRHLSTWKSFLHLNGEPKNEVIDLISASKGTKGN